MHDRIGIFGGSFDPIHLGHLILAQKILEKKRLAEIWFIPAHYHVFKRPDELTSARHRLNMVEQAIKDNNNFKSLDIELKRNRMTFTIETMQELISEYPEKDFYFLLGADNLNGLNQWKDIDRLLKLCQFLVFGRPSTQLNETGKYFLKNVETVDTPQIEISSSDIRDRIRKKLDSRYWLPEKVYEYIIKNGLYKEVLSLN